MKSRAVGLITLISIFSSFDGRVLPSQSNQSDFDPLSLQNSNLEGDIIASNMNKVSLILKLITTLNFINIINISTCH